MLDNRGSKERDPIYYKVADHYKDKFAKYGDTPQGYDWSNEKDMETRYSVMREFLKPYDLEKFSPYDFRQPTVLDFGCGAGGFWDHLNKRGLAPINYTGIDINELAINKAREKFPEVSFGWLDIHSQEWAFNNPRICRQNYDYIVCNGTFTVKGDLTQDQMSEFMCSTLEKLWPKVNKGMAFNLMSKLVDWERDDLYHVSMDQIGQYIMDVLGTRNFVIRNNYGLYEYTVYIYK